MKNFLFLLILIIIFSACKKETEQNQNQQSQNTILTDTTSTNNIQKEQKAVEVKGKNVIFFLPPPDEQRYMMTFYGQTAQWEFQTMFRNLRNMANSAKKPLAKYDINSFLTYSKKFDIQLDSATVHFNLKDADQVMGFLMTDGKKYKFCYGVYNNKAFIKEIRDFFGIPFSFSYQQVKPKKPVVENDTNDYGGL